MTSHCAFCGQHPYEYGYVPVGVTCCDLGAAAHDHRDDDATIEVTSKELGEIASQISNLRWQVERRNRIIEKLFHHRAKPLRRALQSDDGAST